MRQTCLGVVALGLLALLCWTAWVVEDAFITLRTVDNFLHGHGLRWNIAERVQTYTHPLWIFVLATSAFATGEGYYSAMFASTAVSIAGAMLLAYRIATSRPTGAVALLALGSSQAYVDYATSGLENPMTHLLLAGFILCYVRRRTGSPFILAITAGLATLNRMDTLLIFLPTLCTIFRTGRLRILLAGFAPFALWEVFALLYYGFPFPNTAYAKLYTNLPFTELALRGLQYLGESLSGDFVTIPVIAAGLLAPVLTRRTELSGVSLGIVLYIAYVVAIGGGYMSGRFLSAPFFGAVCLLAATLPIRSTRHLAALSLAVIACNLSSPKSPILGKNTEAQGELHTSTSLRRALDLGGSEPFPDHPWAAAGRYLRDPNSDIGKNHGGYFVARSNDGRVITLWRAVGVSGFYAGPEVHIVDAIAIADPLLARIPPYYDPEWEPGHLHRIVPEGYVDTHISGENRIVDENLSRYYDLLELITRGPLFDMQRLLAIIQLNLGQYDYLIDRDTYGNPSKLDIARNDVRIRPKDPLERIALANDLIASGDLASGKVELKIALRLIPDSYDNHMVVGNIYFKSRMLHDAKDAFSRAVDLRPDQVAGLVNLGGTLAAQGEIAGAISAYQRALAIDPGNAVARQMLSRISQR